jgi:hypothetical protein
MIKLFRKIRYDLIEKNAPDQPAGNMGKYLKYAIGEIVLVVIGILIALSLNTANERKNNTTKITNILKEIQVDLEKDINRSAEIFDDYLIMDSIQEIILSKKYTVEDFKSGRAQMIGNWYEDFIIHTNGFDNLMRHLDNLPKKYKPLLTNLNKLYEILKTNLDVVNKRIRKTVYDNVTYLFNKPWARDYTLGIPNNEMIEYFLNDPHYEGLVINYFNDRANVFSKSNDYKVEAVKTYKDIAMLIATDDNIPKTITLKNKDSIKEHNLIGTYRLRDSLGRIGVKKIKISQLKHHLYLIWNDDDDDKFKLNWHKESIYFINSTILNFNKSDTLTLRAGFRNGIFVRDNNKPQ